jgi:hypothetical protein
LFYCFFAVGCKNKMKFLAMKLELKKRNSLCQGFEIYRYKGYSVSYRTLA